jgi:MFS family permease
MTKQTGQTSSNQAVLWTLLLGILATGFPFTILTVALKLIALELEVSEALAAWSVSTPMLISAVCLPFMGKLGDLFGHRRIFLLGISGSTLFALGCFFATDIWQLILLRVLSSAFAGATVPTAMALIFQVFDAEARTRAVGWWAMGGPASAALGLILGGPLIDGFGWRVIFLFQVVTGIVAWLLAARVLPETPRRSARFDHGGNIVLILSFCLLLFAIGSATDPTFSSASKWIALVLGIAGLGLLYRIESRVSEPIIPPFLLQQTSFMAPVLASFLCQAAYLGGFVITPILLISVFDLSISLAALFMLTRTLSLTLASPLGGRMAQRWGERKVVLVGLVIQALGLFVVGLGAYAVDLTWVAVGLVLQGVGHGFTLPPLTTVISYCVPSALYGTASGISRLATQIGASLGLSLFGALLLMENESFGLAEIFYLGAGITLLGLIPAVAVVEKGR